MNQELEAKVPVADQVQEIEEIDDAIKAEYTLEPDGTIKIFEREAANPEKILRPA